MGMVKTQPTDWVWPPALHHHLPTSMGSGIYFEWDTFCAMMGKIKTQPTDWVWPSTPIAALPTLQGSGRYVLRLSCLFLHLFSLMFLLLHLIFILIKYSRFWHGNGENSAHRLSLVTRPYHCLAITDTQQWVYIEGKFHSLPLFLSCF